MPSQQRDNESLILNGKSLGELSFDWVGDRYHHRWEFADSDCKIQSVESDPAEVWPTSPPLQQIHRQSFGDGRDVAFGVGMSGRGHWSASFTLVPELRSWIVELACRSPIEPQQLSSTYALSGLWQAESENLIRHQHPSSTITLEAITPGCHAQVTAEDDTDLQCVRFQPAKIAEKTATSQWTFRVRVAPL